MQVQLDCPLFLTRYEVSEDALGRARAIWQLDNLSHHTVTDVEVTARYFDKEGREIASHTHELSALMLPPRQNSEVTVFADGASASKTAQLEVTRLYFEDVPSPWQPDSPMVELEEETHLHTSEAALLQLKEVAGEDARMYPLSLAAYWVCVCGHRNSHTQAQCLRCERRKGLVLRTLTREVVRAEYPARKKAALARQQKERDELYALETQAAQAAYRVQRTGLLRRTAFLLILCAILGLVFIILRVTGGGNGEKNAPTPRPQAESSFAFMPKLPKRPFTTFSL